MLGGCFPDGCLKEDLFGFKLGLLPLFKRNEGASGDPHFDLAERIFGLPFERSDLLSVAPSLVAEVYPPVVVFAEDSHIFCVLSLLTKDKKIGHYSIVQNRL